MFFLLDTFGRFLYGADYDKANKRPRRKIHLIKLAGEHGDADNGRAA